ALSEQFAWERIARQTLDYFEEVRAQIPSDEPGGGPVEEPHSEPGRAPVAENDIDG
ncbi:MAG: hypothetical protein IT323_19650, partial [Anaerolineae bacterium]|nr:hypothetical protein [Anaerolineae bacterium]